MDEGRLLLVMVLLCSLFAESYSNLPIQNNLLIYTQNFLSLKQNFVISSEDLSPAVMGVIGGTIVVVISGIIIWCMCKKNKEEKVAEPPLKQSAINQIENSVDHNADKGLKASPTLSPKKAPTFANIENDSAMQAQKLGMSHQEKSQNPNEISAVENSAERKLLVKSIPTPTPLPENISPLEQKQIKIKQLFENFSNELNGKYTSEQDKNDFFKPLPLQQAKTAKTDAVSSISRMTVQHPNGLNIQDLVCYTNDKRESPTNSFYEKKIDEINQIQEIALEVEDDKTQKKLSPQKEVKDVKELKETPKPDKEKKSSEKKTTIKEDHNEEEEEEDDDSVAYKEKENDISKNELQPDEDDIISDFHEKTKNFKIEIHKKSTFELDKESVEMHKKKAKLEIFHYQESKGNKRKKL